MAFEQLAQLTPLTKIGNPLGDNLHPVEALQAGQEMKSAAIKDTYQQLVNAGYPEEHAAQIALQGAQKEEVEAQAKLLQQNALKEQSIHDYLFGDGQPSASPKPMPVDEHLQNGGGPIPQTGNSAGSAAPTDNPQRPPGPMIADNGALDGFLNGNNGPTQSTEIPIPQGTAKQQSPEPGSTHPAFDSLKQLVDSYASPEGQKQAMMMRYAGMDPDQLRKTKLDAAQRNAEMELDQVLNTPKWKGIADAVGISKIKGAEAQKQFRAENPGVAYLPTAQQKLEAAFPANPQPNMTMLYGQPMQPFDVDYYAHQLATSQMSNKELMADIGSRMAGPQRAHAIAQIQQKAKAEDPTYSPAKNEADAAYFSNPKVRTTMAQIQQAYQTVQSLNDSFSKIDNSQYPTLTKWAQAFQNQAGDATAAIRQVQGIVGLDEVSTALSRTGTNTDMTRSLAGKLIDMNRSPAQQVEASKMILAALGRTLNAYKGMMGGFAGGLPPVGDVGQPAGIKPSQSGTSPSGKGWRKL